MSMNDIGVGSESIPRWKVRLDAVAKGVSERRSSGGPIIA